MSLKRVRYIAVITDGLSWDVPYVDIVVLDTHSLNEDRGILYNNSIPHKDMEQVLGGFAKLYGDDLRISDHTTKKQ